MITNNQPRPEYPRPDFRRESFQDLNGEWAFAFDDEDVDRKTIAVRTEFAGSGDKRVRVRLSLKGRELVDDTVRVHKNRADRAFRLDQSISLDWTTRRPWCGCRRIRCCSIWTLRSAYRAGSRTM